MRRSILDKPESVEDILETGVLNNWYLVSRDNAVDTGPVPLKRLNRDIVLWRDEARQLHCVEDYCPHRGAKLSVGRVCDGVLACAYHGVRVNGRGEIVAVPTSPNDPVVGQKVIRHYPVQEAHGAIWVYFADDQSADEEPPELIFPNEFNTGEWTGFIDIREFECNYQLVRDNQLDPIHGSFLHAGTHALSRGNQEGDLGYKKTKDGFVVWRKYQEGVNLDRTEVFCYPGSGYWAMTDVPYPQNEGGGPVRLFRYPTPIDRENVLVWNYRLRQASGWQRDVWRFLYRNRVYERGITVLEQDRIALATIPVDAREREYLLQLDIGVSHIRRMYKQEAEKQFKAMSGLASVAAE